jgi:hypothetical protein
MPLFLIGVGKTTFGSERSSKVCPKVGLFVPLNVEYLQGAIWLRLSWEVSDGNAV